MVINLDQIAKTLGRFQMTKFEEDTILCKGGYGNCFFENGDLRFLKNFWLNNDIYYFYFEIMGVECSYGLFHSISLKHKIVGNELFFKWAEFNAFHENSGAWDLFFAPDDKKSSCATD